MPNVTAERFAQGMTFDQYMKAVGSPENLKRQGGTGGARQDTSAVFQAAYESTKLNDSQVEALKWLAAQPNGPAKILVISEDWSSDCQRDIPTMGRVAEASGMELRIFNRDGDNYSGAHEPEDSPNADLMSQFLNHKRGETWQSVPVIVFFTKDMEHLYTFTEYPAIYEKDRLVIDHIRGPRPGESAEETAARGGKEFGELRQSPFWKIWTSAAVDEMISALQRKMVMGAA